MKYAAWLTLLSIIAVLVAASWVGFVGESGRAVAAPPPLDISKYLDEKLPEAPKEKVKLKVDNFACYVCHGNYDGEELVVSHGVEAIGCIDCHGKSYEHRNDEDNITPPEKMYPLEAVDKMCGDCHEAHDVAAREVLQKWQERCPEKTDPKQIVCTDCHYQHRLERRMVRWNKKTGELIFKDEKQDENLPKATPETDAMH